MPFHERHHGRTTGVSAVTITPGAGATTVCGVGCELDVGAIVGLTGPSGVGLIGAIGKIALHPAFVNTVPLGHVGCVIAVGSSVVAGPKSAMLSMARR